MNIGQDFEEMNVISFWTWMWVWKSINIDRKHRSSSKQCIQILQGQREKKNENLPWPQERPCSSSCNLCIFVLMRVLNTAARLGGGKGASCPFISTNGVQWSAPQVHNIWIEPRLVRRIQQPFHDEHRVHGLIRPGPTNVATVAHAGLAKRK